MAMQDMQDKMLGILTLYHGDDFDVTPYLKPEIEHYARASLDIPDDVYLMATMRTSFGKFYRGIVFASDGLYWLNGPLVETSVNHLSWRELSERKSEFSTTPRTIIFGGGAVFNNKGSLNKTSFILNIVDLLIARYEEQEIDADGFVFSPEGIDRATRSIPTNKAQLKAENIDHTATDEPVSIASFIKKLFGK